MGDRAGEGREPAAEAGPRTMWKSGYVKRSRCRSCHRRSSSTRCCRPCSPRGRRRRSSRGSAGPWRRFTRSGSGLWRAPRPRTCARCCRWSRSRPWWCAADRRAGAPARRRPPPRGHRRLDPRCAARCRTRLQRRGPRTVQHRRPRLPPPRTHAPDHAGSRPRAPSHLILDRATALHGVASMRVSCGLCVRVQVRGRPRRSQRR
jgi:hypothetical protein